MSVEFYQIYYKDEQLTNIYPFAKPFKNEGLSIFFENEVIRQIVPYGTSDKLAICSWKLKDKLQWNLAWPRRPHELTEKILNRDYDVLPFTRYSKYIQPQRQHI